MKLICAYLGCFLDSSSALLALAACTALGEIARNGPLLIPAEGEGFTKLYVVKNLLARIPLGKESTKVFWYFALVFWLVDNKMFFLTVYIMLYLK